MSITLNKLIKNGTGYLRPRDAHFNVKSMISCRIENTMTNIQQNQTFPRMDTERIVN